MKANSENRIFSGMVSGSLVHTIGMPVLWFICIKNNTADPSLAFVWYVVCPVLTHDLALFVSVVMNGLRKKGRLKEEIYEMAMAFIYVGICCANYVLLRRFDLSFLIMVLPVIMLLLEHRNVRSVSHVLILIAFYECMQFLPDLMRGEPAVSLTPMAQMIFGICVSACIMYLLWATKDAYAYSFKKKYESELKLKTYGDFLHRKNQDVRRAVHNVKATGELILRNNVSSAGASYVMRVMEACDRIVERVDMILETSRAELLWMNKPLERPREEGETEPPDDGTCLYAPGACVLVVDDSAEALNLVRALLSRTGMKIDTAVTGAEALKKISYNYYNLIVLDGVLPDMSAVQLIRRIKTGNSVNTDKPVIACTGGNRDYVREMYLSEGFADVVMKPLSGEQIERLMEKHLPDRLVSRRRDETNDHDKRCGREVGSGNINGIQGAQ